MRNSQLIYLIVPFWSLPFEFPEQKINKHYDNKDREAQDDGGVVICMVAVKGDSCDP